MQFGYVFDLALNRAATHAAPKKPASPASPKP
jgi:hypothetical protein